MVFESQTEKDTYELGVKTGMEAKPGDVYCLSGDLGTGKTVFTSGLAKGLGVETPICSPTFTILQTYEEGRLPLYHFDVYRIADPDEMFEIGFDEYAFGNGVCIIEWGEMIKEILPEHTTYITIEKDLDKGFDYRKITIC
ncbi:MAG: tRNA (adenosine(37)-N6)-threonylcarbamoyltransferase complex ATPase subunit type 1 TsaE [Parasporobacterium sp.]|nr:tRNA (adenosine(37)-N6)-threonylcarbamoyltransferase complex ATPase subunit type 1 TsaE [Parasporobacterium sp.]